MPSKMLSAAALALLASLASAQTSTDCNPLQKTCKPDPAFAGSFDCDMTKGACKDIFKNLDGTQATYDPNNGGVFSIKGYKDSPTLQSLKYIFFGRVDVTVQAAPGKGVITSFVLQSDDLDEVDIEWVGSDNAQVQSNYFSKGNTATYDRGAYHPVNNPTGQFHTYSLDWSKEKLDWIIDGVVVRTLTPDTSEGGPSGYPQTPMQIKAGTWVAGAPGAPDGTVSWAGGMAEFPGEYIAYYKEIKITDNQGGDSGAKQYIYSDHSGTWESITIDKTGGGNDTDSSSTSSAAPSTTLSTSKATAPATTTVGGSDSNPTGTGAATTSKTAAPGAAAGLVFSPLNLALAGAAVFLANVLVL